MSIDQIGIALTGVTAIFLSQDRREHVRRWACIFGICAQPFWFWSAYHAKQWGVLLLCFLYGISWARGVWTHWIRPARKPVFTWTHGGALVTDALIPGCGKPMTADEASFYQGGRYFIAESMGRSTARHIAEKLGGELREI